MDNGVLSVGSAKVAYSQEKLLALYSNRQIPTEMPVEDDGHGVNDRVELSNHSRRLGLISSSFTSMPPSEHTGTINAPAVETEKGTAREYSSFISTAPPQETVGANQNQIEGEVIGKTIPVEHTENLSKMSAVFDAETVGQKAAVNSPLAAAGSAERESMPAAERLPGNNPLVNSPDASEAHTPPPSGPNQTPDTVNGFPAPSFSTLTTADPQLHQQVLLRHIATQLAQVIPPATTLKF